MMDVFVEECGGFFGTGMGWKESHFIPVLEGFDHQGQLQTEARIAFTLPVG